jgi:hypothetical protein
MIEVELDLLEIIFGANYELTIIAPRDEDLGVEIDRRRHDKSVIVVGVFTDQIDSSRGSINARRRAVEPNKFLAQSLLIIFDCEICVMHGYTRRDEMRVATSLEDRILNRLARSAHCRGSATREQQHDGAEQ